MREYLLHATRPREATSLARLLRKVLVTDGLLRESSAQNELRITADLSDEGARIRSLQIDASDIEVRLDAVEATAARREREVPAVPTEPAVTTEVFVNEASFLASPVLVEGMPVSASGQARGSRFAWVEDAEGRLWVEHRPGDSLAQAMFTVDLAESEPLVRAVLHHADPRIQLLDYQPRIVSATTNQVRFGFDVRCGYGFIRAGMSIEASVGVDDDLVVRIFDLHVSSRNPVLALAAGAITQLAARRVPQQIPVNELLPSGIALEGLSFERRAPG